MVSRARVDVGRHVQQMANRRPHVVEPLGAGQSTLGISRALDRMDVVVVRADVAGPPSQDLLEHRHELDVLLRAARPERQQTVGIECRGVRIGGVLLEQLARVDGVAGGARGAEALAVPGGQRRSVGALVRLTGERGRFPGSRAACVDLGGSRIAVEIGARRQGEANVRHCGAGIESRRLEKRSARAAAVEPIEQCQALVEQPLGVGVGGADLVVKRVDAGGRDGTWRLRPYRYGPDQRDCQRRDSNGRAPKKEQFRHRLGL